MQVIVFTGGGTGGHVYPGLAVIQSLKTKGDFRFVWIGSKKGIERSIVEEAGVEFRGVLAGKLRRYFSWQNFTDLFRIVIGYFQSKHLLKKLKPLFVFSKGGFVSVPPVRAARILKIPVFSHESDLDPGLATKLNLRSSRKVFVAYRESLAYFPEKLHKRIFVTGNPVRREIFGGDPTWCTRMWGIPENVPIVLVLGGSLGAQQVNELVAKILPTLEKKAVVIHQTGRDWQDLPQSPWYRSTPYFKDEIAHLYRGASILIGRAGAGTLWEAAAAQLPMVLVPLVEGSRGDQVRNAHIFADRGAAVILNEEGTSEDLGKLVEDLLNSPQRRATMKEALRDFNADVAADQIAEEMLKSIRKDDYV